MRRVIVSNLISLNGFVAGPNREFAGAHVRYEDGRNDAWESAPAETKHL